MGKAARNRQNRDVQAGPHTGAGIGTVFPNFPYERKFTKEEIHTDILPRAKAFGDLMRDGMGPNGAVLFIPGDVFELWMIHGVLAGADGGKKYIRARRLPEQTGRFQDAVEWVLIKEDTPEAIREDAEREAQMYVDAIDTNLRPEVRAAIRRRMRDAAQAEAEESADSDPERRDEPRDFGAPRLVAFRDEAPVEAYDPTAAVEDMRRRVNDDPTDDPEEAQ